MNQIRKLLTHRKGQYLRNFRYYSNDLFEPDYLDAMKSEIPLYDTVNIQMKGYDYPILESFQKLVHSLAKSIDVNVEDAWALPHQNINVATYKPKSEVIESQYKLKVYQRTVQVTDVTSVQMPLLLRLVETCTPPGVTISVVHHADHYEEDRYIPDKELLDLKQTLEDMGGSRKK